MLTHNELQIRAIQTLWEQHLQEAVKDLEEQYANITKVLTLIQIHNSLCYRGLSLPLIVLFCL